MTRHPYPGRPDEEVLEVAHRINAARDELDAAYDEGRTVARRLRADLVPVRVAADWLGVSPQTITEWTRKDTP